MQGIFNWIHIAKWWNDLFIKPSTRCLLYTNALTRAAEEACRLPRHVTEFWHQIRMAFFIQHRKLFPKSDTLKQTIIVNWHLAVYILTMTAARYPRQNTSENVSAGEDWPNSWRNSYTVKTMFPFPFKLNGIWSWWQFSFRFWTKWNSIWFKIERKPVTTIISHSIWKEKET